MTRIASGFLYRTDVILEKIAIHKVMFFELANLQSLRSCEVAKLQTFNFCDKREQSQVLLELCRVKQKSWAERKIFKLSNYCIQYTFFTPHPTATLKQPASKQTYKEREQRQSSLGLCRKLRLSESNEIYFNCRA